VGAALHLLEAGVVQLCLEMLLAKATTLSQAPAEGRHLRRKLLMCGPQLQNIAALRLALLAESSVHLLQAVKQPALRHAARAGGATQA